MHTFTKTVFLGMTLLLAQAAQAAAPGCSAMFADLRTWLSQSSLNAVSVELTIHQSNTTVSYLGPNVLGHNGTGAGESYATRGQQWFNDRRTNHGDPFSPSATDQLRVYVYPATALLDVYLDSWGGGKMSYPATTCTGNQLVSISNSAVATVSFAKTTLIP